MFWVGLKKFLHRRPRIAGAQVGNGTDGALDECGFTSCGTGLVLGAQWVNKIRFALNQQMGGRAYYAINEWGKW